MFLGRDRQSGEEVAVKVIPKRRKNNPRDGAAFAKAPRLPLDSAVVLQRLQLEADLLAKVSGCGNVGALRAVHESDDAAFVVLSFVDGGDLEALVTRRREERKEEEERRKWEQEEEEGGGEASSSSSSTSAPPPLSPLLLSEKEAAVVTFELLKALTALHSNLVLHGDIKPANIMLDAAATRDALAGRWSRPFLRLADFGLGRACAAQQKVLGTVRPFFLIASLEFFLRRKKKKTHFFSTQIQKNKTHQRGTPVFMAPEVFRGSYGHKADVFAAGVTLHYLLSGRYPYFETLEEVLKLSPRAVRARALGGEEAWKFDGSGTEPFKSFCSPACRDLLASLLDRDEELRPSALEALGHPWFREQLPPEPALMREVEERQRQRQGEEAASPSGAPFGLFAAASPSSSSAADALSPPPLALPPGVAAISAIMAHASMSACSECEMACCPLSGTRLGGLGGGGSGSGGGGSGGGGGSSSSSSSAATSRLIDGGVGFAGGIDGCELTPTTTTTRGLEPPEVDEH